MDNMEDYRISQRITTPFSKRDKLSVFNEIDDVSYFEDEPQRVGYSAEFPTSFYDRPMTSGGHSSILQDYKSQSVKNLHKESWYSPYYPDSVHRRIIDIINHCRYIASKKGMDRRQLIDQIKQDELEGKTYLHTFGHFPRSSVNQLAKCFTQQPTWIPNPLNYNTAQVKRTNTCGEVNADHEEVIPEPLNCIRTHSTLSTPSALSTPQKPRKREVDLTVKNFEFVVEPVHSTSCSYVSPPRPPSRRKGLGRPLPTRIDNSVESADTLESGYSGESDFDSSETCDLMESMGFSGVDKTDHDQDCHPNTTEAEEDKSCSPPIRKPASHNLSIPFSSNQDNINDCESQCSSNDEDGEGGHVVSNSNSDVSSEDQNSDESSISKTEMDDNDARAIMIKAARAHACASFVQLRQKYGNPRKVEDPFFDN